MTELFSVMIHCQTESTSSSISNMARLAGTGLGSGTTGKLGHAWVGCMACQMGRCMDAWLGDVKMMWWGWEKCSGILPGLITLDLAI